MCQSKLSRCSHLSKNLNTIAWLGCRAAAWLSCRPHLAHLPTSSAACEVLESWFPRSWWAPGWTCRLKNTFQTLQGVRVRLGMVGIFSCLSHPWCLMLPLCIPSVISEAGLAGVFEHEAVLTDMMQQYVMEPLISQAAPRDEVTSQAGFQNFQHFIANLVSWVMSRQVVTQLPSAVQCLERFQTAYTFQTWFGWVIVNLCNQDVSLLRQCRKWLVNERETSNGL